MSIEKAMAKCHRHRYSCALCWRQFRQLMTESILLTLLSGSLGLILGYCGLKAVNTMRVALVEGRFHLAPQDRMPYILHIWRLNREGRSQEGLKERAFGADELTSNATALARAYKSDTLK